MNEFVAAVRGGDVTTVRRLLDDDPELIRSPGPDGESIALAALFRGHIALADELAARTGPLSVFEAAAFDDTERLAELIQADDELVVAWSPDGWQPLHLACFFGRVEAARILLDADAEVAEPSRNSLAVHPLHSAVARAHSELVWLLIASDAPVDAFQAAGWTALHAAAANSDVESVRALLAAGADPELPTSDGRRPSELTTDETIRQLLQDGR